MKKREYIVTHGFGDSLMGEIRTVYVVSTNGPYILVYHPAEEGLCASLEFCKKAGDYLVSAYSDVWCNLEMTERKNLKELVKSLRIADLSRPLGD